MTTMRVALIPINSRIADIQWNQQQIAHHLSTCTHQNIDILVFSASPLVGYPALDLLFNQQIIKAQLHSLRKLERAMQPYPYVIISYYEPCRPSSINKYGQPFPYLYHAYGVWNYGKQIRTGYKHVLESTVTQNDHRYFLSGKAQLLALDQKNEMAIALGNEAMLDSFWHQFNAESIIGTFVIDSDYFELGKFKHKLQHLQHQATQQQCFMFYINTLGANDAFIFNGQCFVCHPDGSILSELAQPNPNVHIYDLNSTQRILNSQNVAHPDQEIYQALLMAKRDYHCKTKLSKSVIGISGGIDSAVVLAIDVKAIGKDKVFAILSPSRYTHPDSIKRGIQLCQEFNVDYKIIPIEEKIQHQWTGIIPQERNRFIQHLGKPHYSCVFENQQAMDRMAILRSVANHCNGIISGTSNKSELAMGYGTLCGDIQADIFVIGDVYKHQVYSLARYINDQAGYSIIPESIIQAKPTAELNQGQLDPFHYPTLDRFLELKTEHWLSDDIILEQMQSEGYNIHLELIRYYSRLMQQNRHKQSKTTFAFKVNRGSLGIDFCSPTTSSYLN